MTARQPSDVTKRIRAFAKAERLRDRIQTLEENESIRRDRHKTKMAALREELAALQPTDELSGRGEE